MKILSDPMCTKMEAKLLYYYLQSLLPEGDYMNIQSSEVLKSQIKKWCISEIEPLFASMKKGKALEECFTLITDSWSEQHQKEFIFFLRATVDFDEINWSPSIERKCILQTPESLSEAIVIHDKSLDHYYLTGQPIRLRDIRKENINKSIQCKQNEFSLLFRGLDYVWRSIDGKQFQEAKQLHGCTLFLQIPNTLYLLGTEKNKLYLSKLGEKNCFACLETSIKEIDYFDYEIIPSGSIVITVGKRNQSTGGLLQTECMAFRLENTLVAISLTKEEAEEAEKVASKEVHFYDFSYRTSPLSAYTQTPWKSQIIFKDSILHEFEYGTVIGVYGIPQHYKVVFSSGIYVHVKNENIQKIDLGYPCSACIYSH